VSEPHRRDSNRAATASGEREIQVSVGALLWVAAGALFVAIRIWPIWGTPVGGAELVHLSGAWNAHAGVHDSRYIPTLFQAVAAGLFSFTTSEVPARLLAFAATATVPVALWSVRGRLGQSGALVALVLLAFDAPSLALGSESGAMGFDLAITAWLFALITAGSLPAWRWAVVGFFVSTAGPLVMPLAAGLVVSKLLLAAPLDVRLGAWPLGGVLLGVAFATLRPGLGPDGLTIAPFALFGAAYEEDWSTTDSLALTLMTSWPLVVAGLLAVGWRLTLAWRGQPLASIEWLLLLWGAFGLGWFLTSLPSHAVVPVAGVTVPAALLAGPAIAALLAAMRRADWALARYLVPAAVVAILTIWFYVGDWAELGQVGDTRDKLIVTGLAFAMLAITGALLAERRTVATLAGLALPLAALPMLIATFIVAFRAGDSPTPSPVSRPAARDLRDVALQAAKDGGSIVIHPAFEQELTWPFRDSGTVIITSTVPADAAIIIWPGAGPAAFEAPPEGFAPIEEQWALIERIEPPTRFLWFVRWYNDHYSLVNTLEPVAVYVREGN
jgi:hypothetical protein